MVEKNLVLIVDDDPTTLILMTRYLESLEVPSLAASDGEIALQLMSAHGHKIGLLLLDIAMPRMNGFELCQALRSDPRYATLPIVAVTARVGPDLESRAAEVGIDEIIGKPFHPSTIHRLVSQFHLVAAP